MRRVAQNEVRIPGPKWSQVSDRKLATRVAASRRAGQPPGRGGKVGQSSRREAAADSNRSSAAANCGLKLWAESGAWRIMGSL